MLSISQRLLSGASQVDDAVTTGLPFRHSGALDTTHVIEWDAAVSTGEVTIETADSEAYPDTWTPVTGGVVVFDGTAPHNDVVRVLGAYGAFRHRVTAPLNDGATVTTKIRGSA